MAKTKVKEQLTKKDIKERCGDENHALANQIDRYLVERRAASERKNQAEKDLKALDKDPRFAGMNNVLVYGGVITPDNEYHAKGLVVTAVYKKNPLPAKTLAEELLKAHPELEEEIQAILDDTSLRPDVKYLSIKPE